MVELRTFLHRLPSGLLAGTSKWNPRALDPSISGLARRKVDAEGCCYGEVSMRLCLGFSCLLRIEGGRELTENSRRKSIAATATPIMARLMRPTCSNLLGHDDSVGEVGSFSESQRKCGLVLISGVKTAME